MPPASMALVVVSRGSVAATVARARVGLGVEEGRTGTGGERGRGMRRAADGRPVEGGYGGQAGGGGSVMAVGRYRRKYDSVLWGREGPSAVTVSAARLSRNSWGGR